MKTNIRIWLLALPIFLASPILMKAGESLVWNKDLSAINNWGEIKNKPEGIGEVKLEEKVLTLFRKKAGGDLKLINAPSLPPSGEYRLLCRVKKEGGGAAEIRILYTLDNMKWLNLAAKTITKDREWVDVEMGFKVPDGTSRIVFQFYPPNEIDSSLSISQPRAEKGPGKDPQEK